MHTHARVMIKPSSFVLATGMLLVGCASGGGSTAGRSPDRVLVSPEVAFNGETRTDAAPADPEMQAMADRTARDVEDFLAMRRNASETKEAPPPTARPFDPPPKPIVWTMPERTPSTETSIAAAPPADPPIRQSPLFRPPNEAVEIAGIDPDNGAASDAAADILTPARLDMLLVELRRELFQRSIESNQPIRELLAIATMQLVDPELELQPEAFRQLTAEERELLERMQAFFAELGSGLDDTTPAREVVINALLGLQKALIVEPELELPTATLCWRVDGFGDFKPFDRNVFLALKEQQIILYLEIDGFTSEINPSDQWVTEVSQQLEIYSDRDDMPVWSEPWQRAVDRTNNKRHDFFTTQILTIPKALSVGKYHLKIRARDEKSGAVAEDSIPFEMVADPKLATAMPK